MTVTRADHTPLNEDEVDLLESFLFSEAVSEEALDYPSLHGLLTAVAICPQQIPDAEWLESLFDGQPQYSNADQQAQIEGLLKREYLGICEELDHEEPPELPCDLSLDEDSLLTVWCQGFMEGVFMREEAWFGEQEEEVAELMLPIMIASELFEDDIELQKMRQDQSLIQGLCEEIPDLLTDLYLLFRVPAEPGGPKGSKGAKKGHKRR
ncbi:MAG: YecA family protein [Motiliproteus sp.]